MTEFKIGDRVRDISGHSKYMGLVPCEGVIRCKQMQFGEELWTIDWDNPVCGPVAWRDNQIELVWPSGPIREITRKEIVPGVYGIVEVSDLYDVSGDRHIGIRVANHGAAARACDPTELRAAALVLTQIADALEEPK